MTSPDLEQNRLDWLRPESPPPGSEPQEGDGSKAGHELKVAKSGPVAFFTGCAPYFDVFFSGINVDTLSIARDSIRLLNFLDIVPVVLEKERCCGHDLLWTGDRENFEALCRLNYQEFQKAGVEEVVVSCPECYQVLGRFMPEVIPGMDIKVTLLSDLLEPGDRQRRRHVQAFETPGDIPGSLPAGTDAGLLRDTQETDRDDPRSLVQGDGELGQKRYLLRQQRVHQL